MRRFITVFAIGLALGACATRTSTTSVPTAAAPQGWRTPTSPIDWGDWKRAAAETAQSRFSDQIVRRYAAGAPLPAAVSDLERNGFKCAPPTSGGRGDPPDRVCRRVVNEADCAHTWQTHLWDDAAGPAAKVMRVRGLYDRSCKADDGLLGGPG